MNRTLIAVCALILAPLASGFGQAVAQSGGAPASAAAEQPAVERALAQATPASADSGIAEKTYSDWVREFEEKFQPVGIAREGKVFFSGMAPVRVRPTDPNYGKELVLAYERAMFAMQADFIMQHYGRQIARRRTEVMQNASSNREVFDQAEMQRAQNEGRLAAMFDKALTLMDRKLDNALVEQGVPRERVAQMSMEQKKVLYRDSLTKEVVTSAVRSMQGLVPVQTRIFTETTPRGKVTLVGVIAVQSPKTRQFAEDISRQRGTQVRGDGRKLAELLPGRDPEYLNEIGLRFAYDEQGRPMLISYGRWSLAASPDWSPSRLVTARQIALDQARGLAESSIIEFMNTQIEVTRTQTVGSLTEEVAKQVTKLDEGGGRTYERTQEEVGETIDRYLRNARSVAAGDLRGTSVVKRWEQTDENGVLHVGSVVTWTYAQVDNARAIDQRPSGPAAGATAAPAGRTTADESRESRTINRLKDF